MTRSNWAIPMSVEFRPFPVRIQWAIQRMRPTLSPPHYQFLPSRDSFLSLGSSHWHASLHKFLGYQSQSYAFRHLQLLFDNSNFQVEGVCEQDVGVTRPHYLHTFDSFSSFSSMVGSRHHKRHLQHKDLHLNDRETTDRQGVRTVVTERK
jgi:hypothetical protein